MRAFWESSGPEVGGASMSIINQPVVRSSALMRLFFMHGDVPGKLLRSGFSTRIPFVERTIETEWLYGGATLWRRSALNEFRYDEWYAGYGYLEDVDYSYRVSRKYRLFVVGDARTWHFSAPQSMDRQFEWGRQQVFNYLYFVRKMGSFSRLAIAWSLTGILTMNFLAFLRRGGRQRLNRLRGNFVGLAAALGGRLKPYGGFWK
jgi:GT2 family glycosyltransferase